MDDVWKDKLIEYNGKPITYDNAGNTSTYDGYTFTWEAGRQLAAISGNGQTISYKYNDSGYRTEKIVNGVTSKYYLDGDNVVLENTGSDNIYYSYDADDKLVSMTLNCIEYFYIRNGQGDITGLIDTEGKQVVSYTYNSWGKLVSVDGNLKDTVGLKNPYRYRGYRYDTETGLYYLQSRYYNPEIGRYINADDVEFLGASGTLLSHNLFAYCENNPVNKYDPSGCLSIDSLMNSIATILNNIMNKFISYLKTLIVIKNGKILISTTVISIAIDTMVALAISKLVTQGLKNVMTFYLTNSSKAASSYIGKVFEFFTTKGVGEFLLSRIVSIYLIMSGKGAGNAKAILNGFFSNIVFAKTIVLGRAYSFISAFSSIGGIVALMLDLSDRKFDNYLTIRV